MRVNDVDDDSESGFQMVYGKKNKKKFSSLDANVEEFAVKSREVRVAEKVRPKVPFHIPTISRPQDEYKIIVNNLNQPFEHVWLDRSEDGSTFVHYLEKLSVLDFVDKNDSIAEPIKPPATELVPFKLVEDVNELRRLASKLSSVEEFAVDLEHNHYRSFQGLTCLMQISTRTEDFVIDTLKLRVHIGPYLRPVFKDPTKRKVMHGADRDILWLQRDFSIYVCNMFDTGQASRVLKMERNSLEYLLNHFCGVAANKEYQNADWRLRPLPREMIAYAREDAHYLLYIYDVLRQKLLMSAAESENSDPPLTEVYRRSYDICCQLYEKELLTDDSYLYIYGLQDAGLNTRQLAVVSGLYEWRDVVARAEDESTGYVLPNRTLLELAKQMPVTASKLRHVLRSKHPYIEQNIASVVSIIKHAIRNASAFEETVEHLKARRLEMVSEENSLAADDSELSPPTAPELIKTTDAVEIKHSYLPNDCEDATSISSVQYVNKSHVSESFNATIRTNELKSAHHSYGMNGNEKSETDGCAANVPREALHESGHPVDTPTDMKMSPTAAATVPTLKQPIRAFGALFGNSAKLKKLKYNPDEIEQQDTKLEQIKSTVSLPFHTFSGRDERFQSSVQESPSITEVPPHMEEVPAPEPKSLKEQQSKRAHSSREAFFQCVAVFLPYLNPAELASISLTCNTLYQIAKLVTARRTYDASRTFENVPIPFLNPIVGDSQPYPYFLYTPTQVLQMKPDLRQPWGSSNESQMCRGHTRPDPFLFRVEGGIDCGCVDKGGICDNCPCMECGPSCMCDFGCGNRMTQGGVSVKLKIVKDDRKGWGLYAAELIPEGKFVCEYTGELISTKESRQRQQKYDELASNGCLTPALLVVKEHLPSGNVCIRINIDATKIGNVARFINHSCDGGNLDTMIVRSSGSLLSRVCFFASKEIQENEEISFSYGSFRLKPNGQRCFCDTSSCTGFLPSEHT